MRIDSVLVLSAACVMGSSAVAAPVAVAVAAAVFVVLLWRCVPRRVLVGAVSLLALAAWRAELVAESFDADRLAVWHGVGEPARCAGNARVVSAPIERGKTMVFTADFAGLDCEGRELGAVRARLYGGPPEIRRGDRVHVVAQLAPLRLFRNAELADPRWRAARRGVVLTGSALAVEVDEPSYGMGAWIDAARARARARIQATFAPEITPMARALVLGEDDLEEGESLAFRESGLAHLLAVSGTHLVFAVLGLVTGIRFLLVRIAPLAERMDVGRLSAAAGAVLALLYADFAGGSGSAWRAAWMLAIGLSARSLGYRPDAWRALAGSLGIAWLFDPLAAFDLSLLLSAAATTGLIGLGRCGMQWVADWKWKPLKFVAESVIATVASMLPCTPFLAVMAPSITLAGIVANVVAAPFGEMVALPLCLVHGLLGPLPAVERGAALVASGALLVVRQVALISAATSWFGIPIPLPTAWHWVVLGVAVVGGVVSPETRIGQRFVWVAAGALGLILVELAARQAGAPSGELRVTMLDVGQGDATLVDLPDGRLMLVDGGGFVASPVDPGRRVVLPVLRSRRRSRLDIVVLSHPHPDHFLGLRSVIRAVDVGEVWDTGQGEAEGAGPEFEELLGLWRSRGLTVRRPGELCGSVHRAGAGTIRVLDPCPTFTPHTNANDSSLVLHLSLGSRAVLLPGDAEHDQEQRLVRRYGEQLAADLLKVGHHGSKTSSTDPWLLAIKPRWGTISCGARNRHGHPHGAALDRLKHAGITRLRLDLIGSVTWRTDGNTMTIRAFGLGALAAP